MHADTARRPIFSFAAVAIFFFNVGLEIKHELVLGSLSSLRAALLPCLAALGGMIVPMAIYVGVQARVLASRAAVRASRDHRRASQQS